MIKKCQNLWKYSRSFRDYRKIWDRPIKILSRKEVSLGNDGSISLENLKNCINNDLANNYGNLCQRVFSFIKKIAITRYH